MQQAKQFFDFAVEFDDVNLPQGGAEPVGEHREIRHRRKLQQHRRRLPQQHRQQRQDVRRAVLQQENLASGGIAPRRIGINQIRLRQLRLRRHRLAADLDVRGPQPLEIPPRRLRQLPAPLEIHHPLRHLTKSPRIHTKASGQV